MSRVLLQRPTKSVMVVCHHVSVSTGRLWQYANPQCSNHVQIVKWVWFRKLRDATERGGGIKVYTVSVKLRPQSTSMPSTPKNMIGHFSKLPWSEMGVPGTERDYPEKPLCSLWDVPSLWLHGRLKFPAPKVLYWFGYLLVKLNFHLSH